MSGLTLQLCGRSMPHRIRAATAAAWAASLFLLAGCQWASGTASRDQGDVERLQELARSAEEQRRWSDAVQLLSRAADQQPRNSQLHRRLAEAHLHDGNVAAAKRVLPKAVAAAADDADEQAQLARLALGTGDDAMAARLARRALELDASQIDALLVQANLAEKAGDSTAAAAVYHRILQVEPNQQQAKLQLATYEVENNRPEQAAALLRAVCNCPLTAADKKSAARWKLGQAYAKAGRWNDAARELRIGLADRSRATSDEWYQLAWALHRGRRNREAAEVLQRLLKRNPYHEPSKALLATLRGVPGSPSDGVRYASAEQPAR
jgi:tetratricopeptide (TPR) repeat protein